MKILFFDTETNNLLVDIDTPETELKLIPRLTQLAWIIDDENGNTITKKNFLVEGKRIKNEAQNEVKLLELSDILKEFISDLMKVELVVAHNFKYDYKIISAEFIRNKLKNPLSEIQSYCTMESTIEFCDLKTENGLKYPTLPQLYFKTTGIPLKNKHEALSDTIMLQEAFWKLFIKKQIKFNLESLHLKQFKAILEVLPTFISGYRVRHVKEFLDNLENKIIKNQMFSFQPIINQKFAEHTKLLINAIQMLRDFEKVLLKNNSNATILLNNYISNSKDDLEINYYMVFGVLRSDLEGSKIVNEFDIEINKFEEYFLKKGLNVNDFNASYKNDSDGLFKFSEYERKLFVKIQPYIIEIQEVHMWNSYLQAKFSIFCMINTINNQTIKNNNEGCYIATLCYGNILSDEVIAFKKFRDSTLKKYILGRFFIFWYYKISPLIVDYLKNYPKTNRLIKNWILNPIYFLLK